MSNIINKKSTPLTPFIYSFDLSLGLGRLRFKTKIFIQYVKINRILVGFKVME